MLFAKAQVLKELLPLELRRVASKKESFFWNELIVRYHYLGYAPLPGAHLRYLVYSPSGCLGALGFSAAANEGYCLADEYAAGNGITIPDDYKFTVTGGKVRPREEKIFVKGAWREKE